MFSYRYLHVAADEEASNPAVNLANIVLGITHTLPPIASMIMKEGMLIVEIILE